jgi:hypothetical protein
MAYSSCALNLSQRFRAFSFTDFSGEYAFYFSTGMGTEPVEHTGGPDFQKFLAG